MALTKEQLEFRSKIIGGSDSNIIMGGNDERILRLWKEKRGEAELEDLSSILPVMMGTFTEPFNIQWFEKNTGRKVTHNGVQQKSEEYPYMGCTLDGLTDDGETIFEAKHVSAFAKEEEILDKYLPQLHHNMIVMGVEKAVLSVFYGNHKWEKYDVSKDAIYASILQGAVENFWNCVRNGTPPVTINAPKPVDPKLIVDFTGNNQWANFAQQYRENLKYNKLFDDAAKGLKSMVDEDVAEAHGHGVSLKRDKRGSLRIKGE